MSNEIEVKFMNVTCKTEEVESYIKYNDIKIIKEEKLKLNNRYFDTPNQDLYKNGIALRIRQFNDSYEMTIKTKARVSGGIHIHPEYNINLASELDLPKLELFPAEIFNDMDLCYLENSLLENMSQKCNRYIYLVEYAGAVIEISYDKVSYKKGKGTVADQEIEFELKKGSIRELENLVLGFLAYLGSAKIRIGTLSKMHRAAIYADIAEVPKGVINNDETDNALLKSFESWEINFLLAPSEVAFHGLKNSANSLGKAKDILLAKAFENFSQKLKTFSTAEACLSSLPNLLSSQELVAARLKFYFSFAVKQGSCIND